MRHGRFHLSYRFRSNHVGARPATDDSYVDSGASGQVGELRNSENLMC